MFLSQSLEGGICSPADIDRASSLYG
jgi:hypothetical protein